MVHNSSQINLTSQRRSNPPFHRIFDMVFRNKRGLHLVGLILYMPFLALNDDQFYHDGQHSHNLVLMKLPLTWL